MQVRSEAVGLVAGKRRELWARADVGYRTGSIHMRHPRVGETHLRRNRLSVPRHGGRHLLIYHTESGSQSARALEKLHPHRRTCTTASVADHTGYVAAS